MSNNHYSRLWQEGLKIVSHCPLCQTRHNNIEARILGEDGETHLLHLTCRKCRNSILALVLVNQTGVSSVGLITDLTFEDVVRFRHKSKITVDDVILTHQFLAAGQWHNLA